TSSSSGIVQLKQPRPFSKIEMARRNQAGHSRSIGAPSSTLSQSTDSKRAHAAPERSHTSKLAEP
ncbi:hypothetical protein, partial [Burkholderia gladioli]